MIDNIEELRIIEKRIDERGTEDLRDRWESGKLMLAERKGKQLPSGRLDELVEITGKSRSELQYRIQFAEQYPTENEVSTAVDTFESWNEVRQNLGQTKPKPAARQGRSKIPPELEKEIQERIESGQSVPREELAAQYRVSTTTIQLSYNRAIGRQKALETEATVINWDSIPKTAKGKLETARRQIHRELEREFRARLLTELDQHKAQLDTDFASHKAAIEAENLRLTQIRNTDWQRSRAIIAAHKGVFTSTEYDLIRSCLHPDSRLSVSDDKLAKAFRLFNSEQIKTGIVKG